MKIYVSLTSIFANQETLIHTLYSIAKQVKLPDKCYIYLSEEKYLLDEGFKDKKINDNLQKIVDVNSMFEIKWVKNTGPYRKLLPLLEEKWKEDCFIITVDDDIYYDPNLISNLISDYNKYKCSVSYNAWNIGQNINTINYKNRMSLQQPSMNLYNFATGVNGVLYKPHFFYKTKDIIFKEELYLKYCTTTDDIWFYLLRILNNVNCYSSTKKCILKNLTNPKTSLYENYNKSNVSKMDRNTLETSLYENYNKSNVSKMDRNTLNLQNTWNVLIKFIK